MYRLLRFFSFSDYLLSSFIHNNFKWIFPVLVDKFSLSVFLLYEFELYLISWSSFLFNASLISFVGCDRLGVNIAVLVGPEIPLFLEFLLSFKVDPDISSPDLLEYLIELLNAIIFHEILVILDDLPEEISWVSADLKSPSFHQEINEVAEHSANEDCQVVVW